MQYYDIQEGDFHLTSDGLNLWFYTINSKDVKEPYDGYSSDLICLNNNLKMKDRDYPKNVIKLIEKMASLEEEGISLIDSIKFDDIRKSFREHAVKNNNSKETPKYEICYRNYSLINDGTVIWTADNDLKGDNRVSGWTTSYNDALRSFLVHKMNTVRTRDEKELLEGLKESVAMIKELINNNMTDIMI